MKFRLAILRPVRPDDGFRAASIEYKEAGTCAAERVKMTGYRKEENGEHFPDYRTEFNIRSQIEIDENWRVRQLGGHEYTVVAIVPNPVRGMNTLVCERVNL